MFTGEIPDISNLSWMRILNKYLILLMVVRDIGEMASILYLRKKRSSILSG
jgi:hypothetical protein